MVKSLQDGEETITIEHLERFNGFDKGAVRKVRKADGEVWIASKLAKKASGKKKEAGPDDKA